MDQPQTTEPSPHVADLEQHFTNSLGAVDVLLAERKRLLDHKDDMTAVRNCAGWGFRSATRARIRDAELSIDGIDRALAALRGDS